MKWIKSVRDNGGKIGPCVTWRRLKVRRVDCQHVFHRKGKPIKAFAKAFKAAAAKIGMAELLPHDMRRSAVRNLRRSGLSENEGMALSGHKTDSVYRRHDIISDDDLTESMNRVQEHMRKEAENRKVVPFTKSKLEVDLFHFVYRRAYFQGQGHFIFR